MTTIIIDSRPFQDAGKILKRLPFARCSLPVLRHVEVRVRGGHATLAATTLELRLEVRVPLHTPVTGETSFLLPPEAFEPAMKADADSLLAFEIEMPADEKEDPILHFTSVRGGMTSEACLPTLPADTFPSRPKADGPSTLIPAATFAALATVAAASSTDSTRAVLNGVFFSPEDGGRLVATDGKRLSVAPATVPMSAEFILPTAAVKVLAHRHFATQASTVTVVGKGSDRQVCFHTKNALLFSTTVEGNFPKWKQAVPAHTVASACFGERERKALLRWLAEIRGNEGSVTLLPAGPGLLEIIHGLRGRPVTTTTMAARMTGEVPAVQLEPKFLATALAVGDTLHFTDAMSPVVARNADGNTNGSFCVVMPMRLTVLPEARPVESRQPLAA